MKFNKSLIALSILVSTSTMAQDIHLDQQGDNNKANINQSGANSLSVSQHGSGGDLVINQHNGTDGSSLNVQQEAGYYNSDLHYQITNIEQDNALHSNINLHMRAGDDSISITQRNTDGTNIEVSSGDFLPGEFLNTINVNQHDANGGTNLNLANAGESNTWNVDQSGLNNGADIFITMNGTFSGGNNVSLNQSGSNNFNRLHIEGSGNNVSVDQTGDGNNVDTVMFAWDPTLDNPGCPECEGDVNGESSRNSLNVYQAGSANSVSVGFSGEFIGAFDNNATITQDGLSNQLQGGIDGNGGFYSFNQSGDYNHINFGFSGDGNTANIAQSGNNNNLQLNQHGSGNTMDIMAHGNDAQYSLNQGGAGNTLTLTVN